MTLLNRHLNVIFIDYRKLIDKNTAFKYVSNKLAPYGLVLQSESEFKNVLGRPAKKHGHNVKSSDVALAVYAKNHKRYKTMCEYKLRGYNSSIARYYEDLKS
jgi:hypothetical protein